MPYIVPDVSSSKLLYGRKLRSKLPDLLLVTDNLEAHDDDIRNYDEQRKRKRIWRQSKTFDNE